jgi:hypothetical protein
MTSYSHTPATGAATGVTYNYGTVAVAGKLASMTMNGSTVSYGYL